MNSSRLALDIASVYLVDDMADPQIPVDDKTTYQDLAFPPTNSSPSVTTHDS
jgi:hypothetical protein